MNFQKARLFPGLASSRDRRRRAGLALGRGSSPPSDVAGGGGRERGWLLPPGRTGESFPRLQRPPHIQARPAPPGRAPSRLPAAPLLSSTPMAIGARSWRPPPPPLLLLLASLGDGQAAPVASLGLGSDSELQISERRFVPRVSAHRAQRRLRALPLRGDIPRRPKVRLQVPRPARQRSLRHSARFSRFPVSGQAFPSRRTSPSSASNPRSSLSLFSPQSFPDPSSFSLGDAGALELAGPFARLVGWNLPGTLRSGVGADHPLLRPVQ